MSQKNKLLSVYHQTTKHTDKAWQLGIHQFNVTLAIGQYIYLGYDKYVNNFFFELKTKNTNQSVINVEFYDGAWKSITVRDYTFGFTESNFIFTDSQNAGSVLTTINGEEKHWIRISVDVATSGMVFGGINGLLCCETDLVPYEDNLSKLYPAGKSSHVGSMRVARDQIFKMVNTINKYYRDQKTATLTWFDILDIEELRIPAIYLTLKEIMRKNSDDMDEDAYTRKMNELQKEFDRTFMNFTDLLTDNINGDDITTEESEISDGITIIQLTR